MRSLPFPCGRLGLEFTLSRLALCGALAIAACDDGSEEGGTNNTWSPTVGADAGAQAGGTGGGVAAGTSGGASGGVAAGGSGGVMAGGVAAGGVFGGGSPAGGVAAGGGASGTAGGTAGDGGVTLVDAGAPTDGGAVGGGDAGTPGGGMAGSKPPCLKKPSQMVALGDSYVSLPVVLIPKVEALAVSGGGLMSGQRYRDYSAPGTTLGSPTALGSIPPQWDAAKSEDSDIKFIIMDGGGNDIIASVESIFAGCLDPGARQNPTCTGIIDGCMSVVRQMAMSAKAAGVHDVIYFLYPHVPLGGDDILDYSVEEAQKLTASLTTPDFRVHLIDTRATFEGHPEYFDIDPVHANEAGGQEIAKLVWQKMKSECIAQPASSGCCQP
jgi:hypothetical protein